MIFSELSGCERSQVARSHFYKETRMGRTGTGSTATPETWEKTERRDDRFVGPQFQFRMKTWTAGLAAPTYECAEASAHHA